MTAAGAGMWLADAGSAEVKLCRTAPDGRPGAVVRAARRADLTPGEQLRGLLERHGFDPSADRLRVCSSARGGLRVGLLGLTGRFSLAAAARAATLAGASVGYARRLADPPGRPCAEVDVLVAVGGVDGGDPRHLRAALEGLRLDAYPHRSLVWAGAAEMAAEPDLPGPPAAWQRTGNVLDPALRPRCGPLAETLRRLHLADLAHLADPAALRAVASLAEVPVLPTPAAVARSGWWRSAGARAGTAPAGEVRLAVDVGGGSTEVHRWPGGTDNCVADGCGPAGGAPYEVFAGLGVAGDRRPLLARLAHAPYLDELVDAVAPDDRRAVYQRLRDGEEGALPVRRAFLACLFTALREPGAGPAAAGRLASLTLTGGACRTAGPAAVRRTVDAARGRSDGPWTLVLDEAHDLWARGLAAPAAAPAVPAVPAVPAG
ncbi:glutamate mutase L [Streptomyces sp. cmx-4-9]|uniref:glutamate mutase L n=1 Tax=Streptomyces sp. cmx-4-9 TaxID=2790941 RepID=UPI003980D41A